jgi:type IV pilus assembly protein PilQ
MNSKNKFLYLTLSLILVLLLLSACAGGKKVTKDPFFEKWQAEALKSQGHSPAQRDLLTAGDTEKVPSEEILDTEKSKDISERPLPQYLVNLKMRQATVIAVLRSLARAAGQNIIVKNDIKGEISVDFDNVPWDQAFKSIIRTQSLSYVWEGNIIRILTADDMESDLKLATVKDKTIAQQLEIKRSEPLLTSMINVDYADPKAIRDNLQEFLTKDKDGKTRGSIKVDDHRNALIIQAISDDLTKIVRIIKKIDKPTPQILIKANIVETSKDTARSLGIQWGGMFQTALGNHDFWVTPGGRAGSAIPPGSAMSGAYTPYYGSTGISGQGYAVNLPGSASTMGSAAGAASLGLMFGSIGGNILEVQLSALQNDGKLRILSSPSITTVDNQKAYTENGARVPFVTTDKDGNREVKFEDALLRLEITPHVINDKNLKMKILVEKNEVDETETHKVDGNPRIIKKKTETNLIVKDGETIVISGLTKQRTSDTTSGIPWLKDIPVLGWLFKKEDKADSMEEVLIFITPSILPPQEMAYKKTETQEE